MNRKILLLRSILENPGITQRELREILDTSLGTTNALMKECTEEGYLCDAEDAAAKKNGAEEVRAEKTGAEAGVHTGAAGASPQVKKRGSKGGAKRLTEKGLALLSSYRVDCALILAAGFGSRFVPISYETPKGLVEVFGEPMVERQIRQLHEAGITDITLMVGYRKEKFEYLRDKFGVKLCYNPEYAEKNTLATIYHAIPVLSGKNCYILSSDNWLRENLYHAYEPGAWYSAAYAEGDTAEWVLSYNKKSLRITETYPGGKDCWYMYGPAYFSREFSETFLTALRAYYEMPGTEQYYWEQVLMDMLNGQAARRCTAYFGRIPGMQSWKEIEMSVNRQKDGVVYEFENIEELRLFDEKYNYDSGSEAMQLVSRVFSVPESEIRRIRRLKAGMTNNSWLFSVGERSYICRIPGEGTDRLINRREEKAVYDAIGPLGITEELIYFDADTGYKISAFYEDSRTADGTNETDLRYCMQKLRVLHESGIRLPHRFDIMEKLRYYEKLCMEAGGAKTVTEAVPFADYGEVREKAQVLWQRLREKKRPETIAHIDAVPDNFLFLPGAELSETERDPEKIKLIDWEYCAMCDPLIDISMCAIYAFMGGQEADRLLRLYLGREASMEEQEVYFSYIALGGLLWALWGVYKELLGVRFSDYTLKMYRYFKEYYRKLQNP